MDSHVEHDSIILFFFELFRFLRIAVTAAAAAGKQICTTTSCY